MCQGMAIEIVVVSFAMKFNNYSSLQHLFRVGALDICTDILRSRYIRILQLYMRNVHADPSYGMMVANACGFTVIEV